MNKFLLPLLFFSMSAFGKADEPCLEDDLFSLNLIPISQYQPNETISYLYEGINDKEILNILQNKENPTDHIKRIQVPLMRQRA